MTILTELSSISRSTQSELDSHYKSGSIKRIKLKNFLTYDSVEFMPVSYVESLLRFLEKDGSCEPSLLLLMYGILTCYTLALQLLFWWFI